VVGIHDEVSEVDDERVRIVEDKTCGTFLLLVAMPAVEFALIKQGQEASKGTTAEKLYP
jgi:hypothetical protein